MITFRNDFCLKPFNTFGIPVIASRFAAISKVEHLRWLYQNGEFAGHEILILSEGSNVLFTKDFGGLVLHNEMWGMSVEEESSEHVFLKVNAGESWSRLVEYAVKQGWGGIENLALIPGKVGAAPIQNIGAYGVEVKDVIVSVEAFDMQTGQTVSFSHEQCGFGYRSSFFKTIGKGRYFVTSVLIKLDKNPTINISYGPLQKAFSGRSNVTIADIYDEVVNVRQSKLPDPDKLANAGSFFKNPVIEEKQAEGFLVDHPDAPHYPQLNGQVKLAAGWLIEQCGWKGVREGDVGVHQNQALVLVNYGHASGQQVFDFAKKIIQSVHDKMGVTLEPEVNII